MINWLATQIKMAKCDHKFLSRQINVFEKGKLPGSRLDGSYIIYHCPLCTFNKKVELF